MEDKKKFYTSLNTNNKYITLNDINKILLKGNIIEDVFDIKIYFLSIYIALITYFLQQILLNIRIYEY